MNKYLLTLEILLMTTGAAQAANYSCLDTTGGNRFEFVVLSDREASVSVNGGAPRAAMYTGGMYTSFVRVGDMNFTLRDKGGEWIHSSSSTPLRCARQGKQINQAQKMWDERRRQGKPIQRNQNNETVNVDIYIHW